jgi:CRISPR-associated protein Cas1
MAEGAAGVVIEIAENGRHLALDRGFMVVKGDGREIGRVPWTIWPCWSARPMA